MARALPAVVVREARERSEPTWPPLSQSQEPNFSNWRCFAVVLHHFVSISPHEFETKKVGFDGLDGVF